MFKKRLAFLLTFIMVFVTLSSSVYAESQDIKDTKKDDQVIVVGVSESKLKDKYGDLSDEEIQDILDAGSELIFDSIENKENNLKSLKSKNKYLDVFDVKVTNSSDDNEILIDNTVIPHASDTKPFSDTMRYIVRSTEGTGTYRMTASGTIFNNRRASVERAKGIQLSGANLGSPAARFTPGDPNIWVFLRVKIIKFGISNAGYLYM